MAGSKPTPVYDGQAGELVLYTDDLLDDISVAQLSLRVLTAFPTMKKGQVQLLIEMMIEEGFTVQRAKDAVNHVIRTYQGWDKNPNIANFIGFDRRVKTYTHAEVADNNLWDSMMMIDVGLDRPRWAMIEDVQRHGIKRWDADV